MAGIKNFEKAEVVTLKEQIDYQKGQVVSKTMAQNEHLSVTLFAFDKDEEISTHESGGDAFVTCLDGVGKITIDGEEYILHEGESIVMPAKHPHAVYGQEQFKMLLVVVFYICSCWRDTLVNQKASLWRIGCEKQRYSFAVQARFRALLMHLLRNTLLSAGSRSKKFFLTPQRIHSIIQI